MPRYQDMRTMEEGTAGDIKDKTEREAITGYFLFRDEEMVKCKACLFLVLAKTKCDVLTETKYS